MSFNPHEILFRLRSQQTNANSNSSHSQEPIQVANTAKRGGELDAQPNRLNSINNYSNSINSHQRFDSHNIDTRADPFVQQTYQQNGQFNQVQYNNLQLNSVNQHNQKNQFVSIGNGGNNINSNPKNNQKNSNLNTKQLDPSKHKASASNQFNPQQIQQFTNTAGEDHISAINIQGDLKQTIEPNPNNNNNNNNNIVDYLLNKVSYLEKHVLEHQQKTMVSNKQVSPSRKVKTEVMYDEVAEIISKEPVDKILQKKEKNFVPFASKNSKRFNQPKVAGKLNLEQLQKIMNDYPSLSKPIINIKISEADLN